GIENNNAVAAKMKGEARPRGGGGYGLQLKQDYRSLYGTSIGFGGRGEMIARRENHCAIDPDVVDKYGIPVLRFDVQWSDDEILQIKHFQETTRELIDNMGGIATNKMPSKESGYGIEAPGRIIHEVGVARMGDDPSTSVVNKMCQAHEANNIFVADAASFVSQADKNPTWTIMALSMRTSEHIAEQMKARNL
ncbi:MAG: GMC family oxidoreductase, partial [Rhodothermales bacterium]|nr:GMC family oxidoreductase [Rhodothermales bacterium]